MARLKQTGTIWVEVPSTKPQSAEQLSYDQALDMILKCDGIICEQVNALLKELVLRSPEEAKSVGARFDALMEAYATSVGCWKQVVWKLTEKGVR